MDLDDLVRALLEHYERMDIDTQRLLPLRKLYWPARRRPRAAAPAPCIASQRLRSFSRSRRSYSLPIRPPMAAPPTVAAVEPPMT